MSNNEYPKFSAVMIKGQLVPWLLCELDAEEIMFSFTAEARSGSIPKRSDSLWRPPGLFNGYPGPSSQAESG
jgi:hypothetical protein